MIKPTVGRVVHFTPGRVADKRPDKSQPLAAMIAYVHSDRCVNLSVFEQSGAAQIAGYINVKLLQDDDEAPENGFFCEWTPYQAERQLHRESQT